VINPAAFLNRLSYRVDRAIDELTRPLTLAVAESVRRHAEMRIDGTSIITPLAYRQILADVDRSLITIYGFAPGTTSAMYRLIATAATQANRTPIDITVETMRRNLRSEPELLALLEGGRFSPFLTLAPLFDRNHPAIIAELRRVADTFDPNRMWVRRNGKPYRLSDRVWQAGQETQQNINTILRQSIVTGEDALVTAKKLEVYLNPSLQPIRDATGRLVRDTAANRKKFTDLAAKQRKSVLTFAPGRGGRGSFSARRLARTEIARAHSEATALAGELNPWVKAQRYNTSSTHVKPDECNGLADHNEGIGRGFYRVGNCPLPPRHSHCRCYISNEATDDVDSVTEALRAHYGIQDRSSNVTPIAAAASFVRRAAAAAVQLIIGRKVAA
jgi:hypothetical protein